MKIKILLKILPAFLIISTISNSLHAQSPADSVTKVSPVSITKGTVDSISKIAVVKAKLEISLEGLSRAIYAGRNYGVDQYGLNPSMMFSHSSGLNLSVYSYGMSKTPGLITETDLGASFTFHVSKVFNITPGYTYIINPADSSGLLKHSLNLSTGLDLNFISLNNYVSFSLGSSTAWYDEMVASKYISLYSKGKTNITLSPTFVWVLGTKLALTTLGHGNTAYQQKVNNSVGKGKGKGKNGGASIPSGTTTTSADTSTNFMPFSYEFMLPVTISVHNIAFSLIPRYSIPVNIGEGETTLTGNPFYIVGKISYTIPFPGKKK